MRPGQPLRSATSWLKPDAAAGGPDAGLRERKKARTRQHISDVATRMFLDLGFDAVTVADVAEAADVSPKTVFNYFGSKEELLLDRVPTIVASPDTLASLQRPGFGLIRVMQADVVVRWPAADFGRWEHLTDESLAPRHRFFSLVSEHPTLRGRWLQTGELMGDRFLSVIPATFAEPGSPEATTAGRLLHAAYAAVGRELVDRLLAGDPAASIRERAQVVGLEALALLERAYAGTSLVEGPDPA